MPYHYTSSILPLLPSVLITTALTVYGWRNRRLPGVVPFLVGVVTIMTWVMANMLAIMGSDQGTVALWLKVIYTSSAIMPVAWLVVILQYTNRNQWLTRRHLIMLYAVPIATALITWTNDFHGLMQREPVPEASYPLLPGGYAAGWWFWVHAAYSYAVGMANLFIILGAALRASRFYRRQALTMLTAALLPVLASIFDLLGLQPQPETGWAPVLLGPGGGFMVWALFRYRLFDIMPIARATIIEGMNDGVVVVNAAGQVVYLNPAAQTILGFSSARAMGLTVGEVFSARPELAALNSELTRSAVVLNATGGRRYFSVLASPLTDQQNHSVGQVIALRDTTERKQAEDALSESERKYRELVDLLPEVIFETDAKGRLTFANRAVFEHFGYSPEDLGNGVDGATILVSTDQGLGLSSIAAALGDAPAGAREFMALRKDGSKFPVVASGAPIIHDGNPSGVRGFIIDISESKRMQTQLLQQQRAMAVLEERERLARELHDSIGQVLGFVNMQAQAARALLSGGQLAAADSLIARLATVAHDAQAEVREYVLGARTHIALEQPLFSALEQYLHRFGENSGLCAELIVPEELKNKTFEPTVEIQLLRIIQEALNNARKHASARSVRVTFAGGDGAVQVAVEDDGQGFDFESEAPRGGASFGLRIMRDRAREVGGSLEVFSAHGQGTRITARVPLAKGGHG